MAKVHSEHDPTSDPPGAVSNQNGEEAQSGRRNDGTHPEPRPTAQAAQEHTADDAGPSPALRIAIKGWLGYMDAAILDWTESEDLSREQLRDLLLAAFTASLFAAHQADPTIQIDI